MTETTKELLPNKKKLKSVPAEMNDVPTVKVSQIAMLFADRDPKNNVVPTIGNLVKLLDFYNINCRYNLISKQLEISFPNTEISVDNKVPSSFAIIYSKMRDAGLPVDNYKEYLNHIGEMNSYNPVQMWIKSKKWDGISRIKDLCDTIKATNEDAKNVFIERWLYQAVALATEDNIDAAGILVLQGPQGLGKTWWFRKLVPGYEGSEFVRTGASVDPRDRDSVSQIIRYWIVELGEIGSTFRRSDIDALKAFLTRESDILRRPYGTGDQVYPRRTALAASVNNQAYLHDDTGNRRFWTVSCTEINSYHDIDMQQLWAEIYHYLQNGKNWRITNEERKLVDEVNEAHQEMDPIEEMIATKYSWGASMGYNSKNGTEIAEELGIKNIAQVHTRAIAKAMRKLHKIHGGKEKRKNSTVYFDIPPKSL